MFVAVEFRPNWLNRYCLYFAKSSEKRKEEHSHKTQSVKFSWYQSHTQTHNSFLDNTVPMAGEKIGEQTRDGNVVRKTISPYDITSLDNPGISITQVQLKGKNYDEWARSFRTALRARKKFGFIDRTIKRPDEKSADIEDWLTINSLLVSWIRNTIEPTLRSTISHVEVARDLWNDIRERFSMANGPRIQQLRTELADC